MLWLQVNITVEAELGSRIHASRVHFAHLFPTSMAHRHGRVLRGKARSTCPITLSLFPGPFPRLATRHPESTSKASLPTTRYAIYMHACNIFEPRHVEQPDGVCLWRCEKFYTNVVPCAAVIRSPRRVKTLCNHNIRSLMARSRRLAGPGGHSARITVSRTGHRRMMAGRLRCTCASSVRRGGIDVPPAG